MWMQAYARAHMHLTGDFQPKHFNEYSYSKALLTSCAADFYPEKPFFCPHKSNHKSHTQKYPHACARSSRSGDSWAYKDTLIPGPRKCTCCSSKRVFQANKQAEGDLGFSRLWIIPEEAVGKAACCLPPHTHLSSAHIEAKLWHRVLNKIFPWTTKCVKSLTSSGLLRACPSGPVIPISRIRFCSCNIADKCWQLLQNECLAPGILWRVNSHIVCLSLSCLCKRSCVSLLLGRRTENTGSKLVPCYPGVCSAQPAQLSGEGLPLQCDRAYLCLKPLGCTIGNLLCLSESLSWRQDTNPGNRLQSIY